jgi:CHAD domain-containing protein/CYTH domain-containing protein
VKSSNALLDAQPEAAARGLALSFLDDAAKASSRLGDESDTEALHDFRVGLRRLRTLLKSYRDLLEDSVSKKQRRTLRELASSTGSARDSEVQLAWLARQESRLKAQDQDAWQWLSARLETRRARSYAQLREETVAAFRALEQKLRRGLSRYTAHLGPDASRTTFSALAGERVRAAGDELEATLCAIASPGDVEGCHEARIRAKRLRYLIEPLRDTSFEEAANALVKSIKGLQELLGELHDAHVLASEVATALVESASERARAQHDALYVTDRATATAPPKDMRAGLLAVDRLIRDHVDNLYGQVHDDWLGEKLAPFEARVHSLAEALVQRGNRNLEIERKYLLQAKPAFEAPALEIDQGWIPGRNLRERLRRIRSAEGERFFRTVKVGAGIQRVELEDETTQAVFDKLWPLTEGHRVHKRRYRVPEGEVVWEIDEFLDRELFLAEVELSREDETVALPAWLSPVVVREVTGETEYVNEKLAR